MRSHKEMDLGTLEMSVSTEHANQTNGTQILIIYYKNLVHLFKGISQVMSKEMNAWHLIKALIHTPSAPPRIAMRGTRPGLRSSWAQGCLYAAVCCASSNLLRKWFYKDKLLLQFPVLPGRILALISCRASGEHVPERMEDPLYSLPLSDCHASSPTLSLFQSNPGTVPGQKKQGLAGRPKYYWEVGGAGPDQKLKLGNEP